ncbi:UvrD-helicase domain-containing protein [Kocuria rhizophila]|nr:UvrD-helicase domain-containing protein [Kocuria rhizophila]
MQEPHREHLHSYAKSPGAQLWPAPGHRVGHGGCSGRPRPGSWRATSCAAWERPARAGCRGHPDWGTHHPARRRHPSTCGGPPDPRVRPSASARRARTSRRTAASPRGQGGEGPVPHGQTDVLAQLVERFHAVKRQESALDDGDLLSLAARIVRRTCTRWTGGSGTASRSRCWDEFQHTRTPSRRWSPVSTGRALRLAVGDPQQSIYGFRGASSGQLFSFVENFPLRGADGHSRHAPRASSPPRGATACPSWTWPCRGRTAAHGTVRSWSAASVDVPPPDRRAVRGRVRGEPLPHGQEEAQRHRRADPRAAGRPRGTASRGDAHHGRAVPPQGAKSSP